MSTRSRCTGTARAEHGRCCASLLVLPPRERLRSMALLEGACRRGRCSELLRQSRFLPGTQLGGSDNGDLHPVLVGSLCCAFAQLDLQKQVVATGASSPSAVLRSCPAGSRKGPRSYPGPSRICSPADVTRSTDILVRWRQDREHGLAPSASIRLSRPAVAALSQMVVTRR
jgi:hypothetical protein